MLQIFSLWYPVWWASGHGSAVSNWPCSRSGQFRSAEPCIQFVSTGQPNQADSSKIGEVAEPVFSTRNRLGHTPTNSPRRVGKVAFYH